MLVQPTFTPLANAKLNHVDNRWRVQMMIRRAVHRVLLHDCAETRALACANRIFLRVEMRTN